MIVLWLIPPLILFFHFPVLEFVVSQQNTSKARGKKNICVCPIKTFKQARSPAVQTVHQQVWTPCLDICLDIYVNVYGWNRSVHICCVCRWRTDTTVVKQNEVILTGAHVHVCWTAGCHLLAEPSHAADSLASWMSLWFTAAAATTSQQQQQQRPEPDFTPHVSLFATVKRTVPLLLCRPLPVWFFFARTAAVEIREQMFQEKRREGIHDVTLIMY